MNCLICNRKLDDDAAYCPSCGSRNADVAEYDDYSYEAFISYRHLPKDKAVAKKLQRALEGFRIPKRLRAVDASRAGAARLGKLFRDEDELPVSDSLPDQITRALKSSRFLIVICTPATRESPWVMKEVEAFASYHGRHRVLVALAQGDSAESFPPLLLTRTIRQDDGTCIEVPAEPLAADLRDTSRKSFNVERLRLAAHFIGCGYDDLRQRMKARRVKVAGTAAAVVTAVSLAFGGFSYYQQVQIQENYRLLQVSQSRLLAAKSSELLERGDRTLAIQAALSALPESSTSNDRPYVPEAQVALESASQVYAASGGWRPSYSHREGATITSVVTDDAAGAYAVLDEANAVHVYDMPSGKELSAIEVESEPQAMCMDHGVLVLCCPYPLKVLAYDAREASLLWSRDFDDVKGGFVAEIAASNSGAQFAVATSNKSEVLQNTLTVFDARSGAVQASFDVPQVRFPSYDEPMHVGFSEDGSSISATFESSLFTANVDTKKSVINNIDSESFIGLSWIGGILVAITEKHDWEEHEHYSSDRFVSRTVRCFSPDGSVRWTTDASSFSTASYGPTFATKVGIWRVDGAKGKAGQVAVLSIDSTLCALDLSTGALSPITSFDSVVEACQLLASKDDSQCTVATARDGIWSIRLASPERSKRKEAEFTEVKYASFLTFDADTDAGVAGRYLLAMPADSERRAETIVWNYCPSAEPFEVPSGDPWLYRSRYNLDGTLLATQPALSKELLVLDPNTFAEVSRIGGAALGKDGSYEVVDYSFSHSVPDKLFVVFGQSLDSDSRKTPDPSIVGVFDARSAKLLGCREMNDIGPDCRVSLCSGEEMLVVRSRQSSHRRIIAILDPDTLQTAGEFELQSDNPDITLISSELERSDPYASSATAWSDGNVLLLTEEDYGVHRLVDLSDFETIECDLDSYMFGRHESMVYCDGAGARFLGARGGELYCFDLPGGNLVWSKTLQDPIELYDQMLFADEGKKIVLMNSGSLEVLDSATGSTLSKASSSIRTYIEDSNMSPITLRDDRYLILRCNQSDSGSPMLFVFDLENETLSPISVIDDGVTLSADMSKVLLHNASTGPDPEQSWLLPYLGLDELVERGRQAVSDFPLTDEDRESLMIAS